MTIKPIPEDACQRCFQHRQGLVPLSDLVRELFELGVKVLVCRSCMKEMGAVANFLSFQGCQITVHPMMRELSLSSSTKRETLDESKTIIRHDNDAVEASEGPSEPSLKKDRSK